jgi:pantoate--beta-alanine ligase
MMELCRKARANGRRIGFVPTMGALHDGHLQLVRRVREMSDLSVVSIFVNPTQFGPDEDLVRYPRDLAGDLDRCAAEHVDYVFAPAATEIYPPGAQTFVEVEELSRVLEGASRPGHFRGVSTVVLKLLEIVRPTVAAFGQKDYQQNAVIRRMVRDLMLDVEILVLPIVRDADGLALSSRNRFLTPQDRQAALALPRALAAAREAVTAGQRSGERIAEAARGVLEREPRLRIDYVAFVDRDTLEPLDHLAGEAVLLLAVYAGDTRLLDNGILAPHEGDDAAG